jgi:membrane associated rhomboid family serine protease
MRRSLAWWPLTPAVKKILIANAAVWLIGVLSFSWAGSVVFIDFLALTPFQVVPGLRIWQLATYMWLHSPEDLSHILFNSLFLWMFGGTLEQSWGSRAFWRFYLTCGVGAGLVVLISGLLFNPSLPVLGASGAIYGLVVAWAIAFPNKVIYFFGIFPMKGKHFVLIPIGYAVLDFLTRAQGVSHAAHIGGMAVGALLVTGYWRPAKVLAALHKRRQKRRLKVIQGKGDRQSDPPKGGYWH